ncbi:hypothetical protein PIB30_001256 [Stylosanthes scabra]|uniref:Uncharacterized protein n=1 Tax=Stylosanthes scabra TaxID=79078 RepID=A0ABU6X4H7_9FABA|nr:hypothetical protein [Stylosanthes scabra]
MLTHSCNKKQKKKKREDDCANWANKDRRWKVSRRVAVAVSLYQGTVCESTPYRVAVTVPLSQWYEINDQDEKQVEETVAFAVDKYGSLDIMFSNAGVGSCGSSILDLDLNGFDNTMAVNLRGAVACIKHAARVMVERKTRGSIICTASVAGSVCIGAAAGVSYIASKHGLMGLVRSACGKLGGYGIRVNSVSPYIMATPLVCKRLDVEASGVESASVIGSNLQGIVLKPIHVAEAALFLASDQSAYISGQDLAVDGGFLAVNRAIELSLATLKN